VKRTFLIAFILIISFSMQINSIYAARGLFSQRIQKSPRDFKSRRDKPLRSRTLEKAKVAYLKKNYAESIQILEQFLRRYKNHTDEEESYYYLALAFLSQKNYEKAFIAMDRLIYQDTSRFYRAKALLMKAQILLKRGKKKKALYIYLQALKDARGLPDLGDSLLQIAQIYGENGNAEKANKLYELALKEYPLGVDRAIVLSHQKKLKKKYYSVQVGAYSSEKTAQTVTQKFLKKGYSAFFVKQVSKKNTPIFKVRIGRLPTQKQGGHLRKKLWSQEKTRGSVVFDLVPL
jgi:tetratricopeptide (TPR) repeat protein